MTQNSNEAVRRDQPVRRALLLAGGTGTRLRPLTMTVPKCLVPIHGRPLLDYWLEMLFVGGFERVLVNTHWLAPAVEAFVARSRWRSQIDLVNEPELLGTGGTILANRSFFAEAPFLVAHADNLISFTISKFLEAHRQRAPGAALTMLAFHTDDPSSCGILECDERGVVLAFHEKVADPPGTLANGAVYVVEDEVVRYIAGLGRHFVDLSTEVVPAFLGRIQTWTTDGYHRDIGNLQSLARAEAEFPVTTK
jgi:mannose-1-phosphate guanylyltransferase